MASFYHAGVDHSLPYLVRVEMTDKNDNPTHADMVIRWIEFWCQQNCEFDWSVTEQSQSVDIGFADEQDLVFFKLSPEFNQD